MSWRRLFRWVLTAVFTAAAFAFLILWLYFRGTPDNISDRAIPPTAISSTSPVPQVLRIWPGKPPGSENWTQQEMSLGNGPDKIIRNVVDPTLTAYFPPRGKANGAAVIICPGGGFHVISIVNEGVDVARYVNSLGITAFVLQYRLTRTNAAFYFVMMHRIKTPGGMDSVLQRMTPLMLADGQQAVRFVRLHAVQWGLTPHRIGIIGFSAGGFLALEVALHNDAAARPDFLAAIYPLAPKPLGPPAGNIPMFSVCANDDPIVPPENNCERVVDLWHAANVAAELHVFAKGGHGFGMRKQNLPIDGWPQLLRNWLQAQGFIPILREPAQATIGPKKTILSNSIAAPAVATIAKESIR
jgi:acetyl esterase/lipase